MSEISERALHATPGDVLFSVERIPDPGLIVMGTQNRRGLPQYEPYLSFKYLQQFLEFLEFVVLTERIIVPLPSYSPQTSKLVSGRRTWFEFAIFHATGDVDLNTDQVIDRLDDAGVMHCSHFDPAFDPAMATSDAVAARLLIASKSVQQQFDRFLSYSTGQTGRANPSAMAHAHLAVRIGTPMRVAEVARLAKVPYVLGPVEEKYTDGVEREGRRVQQSVATILLGRLNAGARKEIERFSAAGLPTVFPETPIATMLLMNSTSPQGLIETALQLRSEFASFRQHMNSIESDLVNDALPLKTRLKRMTEIARLASHLWPNAKTDMRKTALGVSDTISAIPEVIADPSPISISKLAGKLLSLPTGQLMDLFRRRKIRLLLKARRNFMQTKATTERIATIFRLPVDVVAKSRFLDGPIFTARYAARNRE